MWINVNVYNSCLMSKRSISSTMSRLSLPVEQTVVNERSPGPLCTQDGEGVFLCPPQSILNVPRFRMKQIQARQGKSLSV